MLDRTILALATALALAPATAIASPRSDPTLGRAVFTGATMPSPTSLTLNPAALGLTRTWELFVGATGVLDQLGIDRRDLDVETGVLSDGERVSDLQFGPGATIGYVFAPGRFTNALELRLPPPELFPSDPALRYHTQGSRQRDYVVSAGSSFRIASNFYIGVSLSHEFTALRLRYARDTALDRGLALDCGGAPCGVENPLAAETYDVDVRSGYVSFNNLRGNLGVLVRLARDVWLGLSYHNTPGFGIQSELLGHMRYTQAPRDGGAQVSGGSTVYVSYPASIDGELRARLLPDLDLHIGGRWEDLSRMQAYDVRGYGRSFDTVGVQEWVLRPRGFRDSFAMWAGVEQVELDQAKRFRFGGRLGLETPSLKPSGTSPGNMSSAAVTIDAGAQIRISPRVSVQLSYGLQAFSRVDVTDSQYDPRFAVQCIDSGFDYETRGCQALREGYAIPTAAGTYSRLQHAFRLGILLEPSF